MGNYKSLSSSQQQPAFIIAEINENGVDATTLLARNRKKNGHISLLSSKKLNLVRHFRNNFNHQRRNEAQRNGFDCTDNKKNLAKSGIYDNEPGVTPPQIALKPPPMQSQQTSTDPDYITISESHFGQHRKQQQQQGENFYESTSEILNTHRSNAKPSTKSIADNYFSIYGDHFNLDGGSGGGCTNTQAERDNTNIDNFFDNYTIHTIIVKANSTNNLYSEVNVAGKAGHKKYGKSNSATQNGQKSATLAKTGINLSKFINGRKYNLHSITKLLQKLTRGGASRTGATVTIKIPPKSFDPDKEFYFDLNEACRSDRPNPPTILPPPLPMTRSNTSDEADSDDNSGFNNQKPDQVDSNDINNNKSGLLNEDNYQSVPEYDYIATQTVLGGVAAAAAGSSNRADILMIDDLGQTAAAPEPPPASTQPNRASTMSQLYTSIEPFNLNNEVYYAFTSPSGTTFASTTTTATTSSASTNSSGESLLTSGLINVKSSSSSRNNLMESTRHSLAFSFTSNSANGFDSAELKL
jgi:hypothetical protein